MRLTCPSCGAQYEVDDSVIPETGRDVQCSNCGHAWFQMPASSTSPAQAPATAPAGTEPPAPEQPTPPPGRQTQTESTSSATSGGHDQDTDDTGDGPADTAAMPAPPPRKIDESVLSVLREEAERERRAREAERGGVETQSDLGLETAPGPSAGGARPMEPEAGQPSGHVKAALGKAALPDIEEIKSTLRASSERGDEPAAMDAPEAVAQRDRRGFRTGFSLALLVAICLVAIYLFAPQLAERFPALKPGLATYAQGVDGARMWLDARMQDLTTALQGE